MTGQRSRNTLLPIATLLALALALPACLTGSEEVIFAEGQGDDNSMRNNGSNSAPNNNGSNNAPNNNGSNNAPNNNANTGTNSGTNNETNNNSNTNNNTTGTNNSNTNNAMCVEGEPCVPEAANAEGMCDADGMCVFTACSAGFDNCNGDLADGGCEAALDTVDNCGVCGEDCEGDEAIWSCGATGCVVEGCVDGFVDANDDPEDGCETVQLPAPEILSHNVINNGLSLSWTPLDAEVSYYEIEVIFGTSPPRRSTFRAVGHGANETMRQVEVIGPFNGFTRPDGTITVRGFDANGAPGAPSDDYIVTAFTPAGFYNTSLANQATSAVTTSDPEELFISGIEFAGYQRAGGRRVASKLAVNNFWFHTDIVFDDGPNAGHGVMIGFDGQYQTTTNGGVAWRYDRIEGESSDGNSAVVLPDGTMLLSFRGGIFEGSQSREFTLVEQTMFTNFAGMSKVEAEDGWHVFALAVSYDISPEQGGVFHRAPDGTWTGIEIEGARELNGIHMISTEVGFAGGDDGAMFKTADGWMTAEAVTLPNANPNTPHEFERLFFDPSGTLGFVPTYANRVLLTEDGGDTWTEQQLPQPAWEEELWFAGAYIEGSADRRFLLFSTSGSRIEFFDGPNGREMNLTETGYNRDLIAVTAWDSLDTILAVTRGGQLLRGLTSPGTLTEVGGRIDATITPLARFLDIDANANGDSMFALATTGAYFSNTMGMSWASIPHTLSEPTFTAMATDVSGTELYVVGHLENETRGFVGTYTTDGNSSQINLFTDIVAGAPLPPVYDVDVVEDDTVGFLTKQGRGTFQVFLNYDEGSGAWTTISGAGDPTVLALLPEQPGKFYVGGENGYFQYYDGDTFTTPRLPLPGGQTVAMVAAGDLGFGTFTALRFPHDATHGWLMSDDGWLFSTRDGTTWDAVDHLSGDKTPRAFHFATDNTLGVVVGERGTTYWTGNGGVPMPPLQDYVVVND